MRSSPVLPPLHALRAFEAVGRLLSFRKAGEELLITQSAVSHHIRQLEQALGTQLFVRKAKSIELTQDGEEYLKGVAHAFEAIAEATDAVRHRRARKRVRVSLLPSFAANWLIARLPSFREQHPEVDVEIDPTLKLVEPGTDEADLAIRFGAGKWKGVHAELLMPEHLSPVVSPGLFGDGTDFAESTALVRQNLLLSMNPMEWRAWTDTVGINIDSARSIQLTDYNVTLQAALDGQGVAMGRLLQIADILEVGKLVRPFSEIVVSNSVGHWVVTPVNGRLSAEASLFIDWVKGEASCQLSDISARRWA